MKYLRPLLFLLALPLRAAGFGDLPIVFEPNVGQTDPRVRFLSREAGSTLFLTGDEAVLALSGHVLRLRLEGAGPGTSQALEPLPGVTNYYVGNDPAKWHTGVPQFGRVRFAGVYPGIDLDWYGREGSFELDFVVAPRADPDAIGLSVQGAERLEIAASGDLVLHLAGGELTLRRPVSWQEVDGKRREVSSSYRLVGGRLGFDLGDYDRGRPLVIDPVLDWSSFLGGSETEQVLDVASTTSGRLYATGITASPDFPGAASPVNAGAAFVTRISADGRSLVFTTILDGKVDDAGLSIAVDGEGAAYISGQTHSYDFPLVNAFQPDSAGALEVIVAKLDSSGKVVFSTFLGGRDWESGEAVAIDADRRVYVAGWTFSGSFPLKKQFQEDALFAGSNAFLTVLSADGQSLVYSTLLRGDAEDAAYALAVDSAGNAYLAGRTKSKDFPVKGAFQGDQPGTDAFVAKINPAASGAASLVYSTYLGGPGTDTALGIAVDGLGQAHVTGATGSAQFPLVREIDGVNVVNEAFVTKLNAQGNDLLFSTFLGGADVDQGSSIAVDATGAVYVTGHTGSAGFPEANGFQPQHAGGLDVFVAKIDPAVPALLWSSFLGGTGDDFGKAVTLDVRGNVYLGGETRSQRDFPAEGGFQESYGGGDNDGFVARIANTAPDTIGLFRESAGQHFLRNSNATGAADLTVTLGQAGDLPLSGDWIGIGDRPGIFRAGTFTLKAFNNDITCCNITFGFGQAGDLPVGGDWDGNGFDSVGVFRPSTSQFFLTDTNGPLADRTFTFGEAGDLPVAGDWDGDGVDTVGVFRPSTGQFFLTNTDGQTLDLVFEFGLAGDLPLAGDWNGDGIDTIGILRNGFQFLLRNSNSTGAPDLSFAFGTAGDQPIAGDWDGRP